MPRTALVVLTGLVLGAALNAAAAPAAPRPPVAAQRPHLVRSPHGDRQDEYYWLRDDTRKDPALLAHLAAENAYKDAVLAPTAQLRETLYGEIVGRIKQDDATVPSRKRGWWYYARYETGKEYPVYARRRDTKAGYDAAAPEQVLLDGNAMGAGKAFFAIGAFEISRDDRWMAYAVDTVGRRQYEIRIKDLRSGKVLSDRIVNAEPTIAWHADGRSFLWIEKDPTTLLGNKVRRHVLGTDPAGDALVYEEQDDSFYMDVANSRSDRFIYISLGSTVSSEWWYADAGDPALRFTRVVARERDHEYDVEDLGDDFVIRTNWRAKNFRIVKAPIAGAGDRATWRDVIPHRDDALVDGFATFERFIAVDERSGGLHKVRLKDWRSGKEELIAADDPAYTMDVGANPQQDTPVLRYRYTSLTTPLTTYELDTATGERRLLKRDPVLGGFRPEDYASEFIFAPAADGARIPVSILYRKGTPLDGTAPLYQYAYGSYGSSTDPEFKSTRLSLVDRGFVFAIAHVRGGQEMGRQWYEDGKLLKKDNTFTDFIAVTEHLVAKRYAARDKVFAQGGSAGGLLMGAIANLRPDLYRGIVAHVPFVDVVTTMLDESIPLTTGEFDEWGDPKQKPHYDHMLSYSPYDNVAAKAYPAMFVTTGLWDSQVQYYEPAKWVARLRRLNTGREPILFHVNMDAGHGGRSGRFQRYREIALEYSWVLQTLGVTDAAPLPPVGLRRSATER
jgi:oligopeptidase B